MRVTEECAQQFLEVFQLFVQQVSLRPMRHMAMYGYSFAENSREEPQYDFEAGFQRILNDPYIVERFIDKNWHSFSDEQLAIVQEWKDNLCGTCIALGFVDDYVVVDHDGMLYAAEDISGELKEHAAQMPFAMETMMLPCAGEIVLPRVFRILEPFDAVCSEAEAASLLAAKPSLVRGAEAFCWVARVLHEQLNKWVLEQPETDRYWIDDTYRSFHSGALYGIDSAERERLRNKEAARRNYVSDIDWWRRKEPRPIKQAIEPTLPAALSCVTKDCLLAIARVMRLQRCSALRKPDLAQKICEDLLSSQHSEVLSLFVEDCSDAELDLIEQLLGAGGTMGISADGYVTATHAPLSFACQDGDDLVAFIPREFRDERLECSLRCERAKRRHERQARLALEACVFQYGIIPFEEAYEEYAKLAEDPGDIQWFHSLGMERSGKARLVRRGDTEYLMHASLSIEKVDEIVSRVCRYESDCHHEFASRVLRSWDDGALRRMTSGLMEPSERDHSRRIRIIRTWIEDKNAADLSRIIEAHGRKAAKPLDAVYLEYDPAVAACRSPEGRALQAILDGLVPYNENEYLFADRMLEEIVTYSVECGELDGAFDILRREGYDFRAAYAPALIRSVANLYNSLPSWEECGWSARELAENAAGKQIMFGSDGVPLCAGSYCTVSADNQLKPTDDSSTSQLIEHIK